MKTFFRLVLLFAGCLLFTPGLGGKPPGRTEPRNMQWADWLAHAHAEIRQLEQAFQLETEPLRARLAEIGAVLQDPRNRTPERGFELLWEQDQLEKTLDALYQEHELKLLKVRYRKSIEILKIISSWPPPRPRAP